MPGKYSHSVVLADYSSRGIINLPNDQHVAYLRSSPYSASPRSRNNSITRSESSRTPQPRSKSAMAFTSHYGSVNGTPGSLNRQVIVDTGSEPQEESYANIFPQRSATSHNFRAPTSKEQQSISKMSTMHSFNSSAMGPQSSTMTPVSVKSIDIGQLYGPLNQTRTVSDRVRADEFLREMPGPPSQPLRSVRSNGHTLAHSSSTRLKSPAEIKSKQEIIPSDKQPNHTTTTLTETMQVLRPPQVLYRKVSQETQIHAPNVAITEPNFEGFSDSEEQQSSYFGNSEKDKSPVRQKMPLQINSSSRLETPSPRGPPIRVIEARPRTFQSLSTEPSDPDIFSDVGASPLNSYGKPDSLTSLSTFSSRETSSVTRPGQHLDARKAAVHSPSQDWRLPEIAEDGAFGPDFFTQGPDDTSTPLSNDDSIDSFLDRPLGTISAGRDFDFSNPDDDADSDVDAACPPDIARFRDDEENGKSTYLQPKRSDSMMGKSAFSVGQTSKGKKMGFFARFRSKSRQ